KSSPEGLHLRILASNRAKTKATLWLLPQLWFRNTWSWQKENHSKPLLYAPFPPAGAAWGVAAEHPTLGTYHLYGRQDADLLYTENESNNSRLWGERNTAPFVKDAFHRYLIEGESTAVNPARRGTKFGAVHELTVDPGQSGMIDLVLSVAPRTEAFDRHEQILG